jgi:hypothetical protein
MLQIDHIYEFFYENVFKGCSTWFCKNGVVSEQKEKILETISIFNSGPLCEVEIFFYDQEPYISLLSDPYIDIFSNCRKYLNKPYFVPVEQLPNKKRILVTSEISGEVNDCVKKRGFHSLYYFFHGFAALDWYRGYYALNFQKKVNRLYKKDFITYNRLILKDRSYRIYFVSKLIENNLINMGLVSFNVSNDNADWKKEILDKNSKLSKIAKNHIVKNLLHYEKKLIIDGDQVPGQASANIPRSIIVNDPENNMLNLDSFWHVVTETVFYYNKLHLTEKIFKPIVSKQPFMLLAAPGNLAYLKSYGFKTFDSVIDESYDAIQDPDQRIDAVVDQLNWYCNLTDAEKLDIAGKLEPIIEHNFRHFYGEFRHIITRELLDNCQTLFKEIGYDDSGIAYGDVYRVLTA